MEQFDVENFKQINAIIERDSKDATYKFALLRGAIEISQEYDHLKLESGNRILFPLGLLIEKWILYYFPLIASREFIPQKNGEKRLSQYHISFRDSLKRVTDFYDEHGGFSVFYNDYTNGTIPPDITPAVRDLIMDLKRTITTMPMKHLGRSVYRRDYSIFEDEKDSKRIRSNSPINREILIDNLGHFSLPKELFAVFQYLGSFISGEDSLLYQWAEFTSNASKGAIRAEFVIEKLRTYPQTDRDVQDARTLYDSIFRENGSLECVWSGQTIKSSQSLHIDHVIPFTVWRNNDLWNLLPALSVTNAKKRDRIPSSAFIEKRRETISRYWDLLEGEYSQRFRREMTISLLGKADTSADWHDRAIQRLMEKCEYLINVRGFEGWSL